jgi:plastocyanin
MNTSRRSIAVLICLLSLFSLFLTPSASRPAQAQASTIVELPATDDARIQGGSPDTTIGEGFIWVGSPNGHLALVQFDLLDLPANATIISAELRLSFQGTYTGTANVEVGRNLAVWDETSVTWATQPGNLFNGNIQPVGDTPGDIVWPVTGLVAQWNSGALPNYGFALRGDGQLKAFHSKETGCFPTTVTECEAPALAPRLVVSYTTPPAEGPWPDLGDAPDSSNSLGISPNTAYPGVPGNFPTVWGSTPAGQPAGPRHNNPRPEAILGDHLSREAEADSGPDADGVNNILNGGADNANNDRGDDGWRNRNASFEHCQSTTLTVRVRKAANAQLERMFLNVWFDGTHDGDWNDRQLCTPENETLGVPAYEWIVQNYYVDLASIPAGGFVDINVNTQVVLNLMPERAHWMRFTLSERRAPQGPNNLADGRGPHPSNTPGAYEFGETEDVLQRPQPPAEPGTLTLEKRSISDSNPVDYLDLVTHELTLRHIGGSAPITAELRDVLPSQGLTNGLFYYTPVFGQVTVDARGGASPTQSRVEIIPPQGPNPPQWIVRWRGTLPPNSAIRLRIPSVTAMACLENQLPKRIENRAQARSRSSGVLSATAELSFNCPGFDIEKVPFDWTDTITDLLTLDDFRDIPRTGRFQNNLPYTVTLNLFQERATGDTGAQTAAIALPSFGKGREGAHTAATSLAPLNTITLGPGERRDLGVVLRMENEFSDELKLPEDFGLLTRLAYCVMPGEGLRCPDREQAPQIWSQSEPLSVTVRPSDLGDAPDSSNHFGVAMTAYPGIQANFPTVFDPATGLPRGPRHAFPRPFHLGPQVSREAEADVSPDQDPLNNLVPAANNPDNDRFDDGSRLTNLAHCQPATAEVRVFISPQAFNFFQQQERPAYLNVWADSNRDGDWDDGASCQSPQGQAVSVVEHILIDAPIDVVALGPGLHALSIPTSRVAWPAQLDELPAWLRFTLSERPSNKPLQFGGITYGDGRGHDTPFRTGETEDHLLRPQGPDSGGVPDMAVSLQGRVTRATSQPGAQTLALSATQQLRFKVEYANLGAQDASGATLVFSKPAQVLGLDLALLRAPGIPAANIVDRGATIDVSLPTVPAGETGAILLGWATFPSSQAAPSAAEIYTASVRLNLTGDPDPSNNQAELGVAQLPTTRPPRVAAVVGGGKLWGLRETTCRRDVQLALRTEPNTPVDLLLDNTVVATLVEDEGIWFYTLQGLSAGRHQIDVVPSGSGIVSPRDSASGLPSGLTLDVDLGLPINPLSLVFSDSRGRSFHPPTLGWANGQGQASARLQAGETYEVAIQSCADDPNQQITLVLPNGEAVSLSDEDGDGRYTGSFVFSAARSSVSETGTTPRLIVTTGSSEQSFELGLQALALGIVRDALSGQALEGASVAALDGGAGEQGGSGEAWPEAALGQPNPQTTGADGGYSFTSPGGLNRLDVVRAGYQPYRSWNLLAEAGTLAPNLALTPEIAGPADHTIFVSASGFSPAVLTAKPGELIEWVNVELDEHTASGTAWDSGALQAGQRYRLRLNRVGSYSYGDAANPLAAATIRVEGGGLFLPIVLR